ncbi:MAG: hypothetical protein ACRD2T_11065 [Thermoanaerobaculia bacterium]
MKQLVFELLGLQPIEVPLKLDPKSKDDLVEAIAAAIVAVVEGREEGSDEGSAVRKQDHV